MMHIFTGYAIPQDKICVFDLHLVQTVIKRKGTNKTEITFHSGYSITVCEEANEIIKLVAEVKKMQEQKQKSNK